MIRIESDNNAIEKNIRELEKTVVENGGHLDPGLVIKCENGGLSILKDGIADPHKMLIMMPQSLLLPSEEMGLSVKDDTLISAPNKQALSDVQYRLCETMIDLYNLTAKIPDHRQSCAWVSYRAAPEALEILLDARTINEPQKKFFEFTKTKDVDENTMNEFLCDTYLKTRTIGHKEINTETDAMSMITKIMPIVDFVNHDSWGSPFNFTREPPSGEMFEEEYLLLADRRPILERRECFAFYNQMDAIDAFLNYGFPDARAPVVRAVPIEIDVPRTGKLIIHGYHSQWKKGKLSKHAAGLQPFIPQTMENEEGVLAVSHLLIPCGQSPQALRRVLRLMISNMTPRVLSPEEIWEATLAAEEEIISKTLSTYERIAEESRAALQKASTPEAASCWKQTHDLASLQLTKLYKYTFSHEHYDRGSGNNNIDASAA